jgi:hypothetical protein
MNNMQGDDDLMSVCTQVVHAWREIDPATCVGIQERDLAQSAHISSNTVPFPDFPFKITPSPLSTTKSYPNDLKINL